MILSALFFSIVSFAVSPASFENSYTFNFGDSSCAQEIVVETRKSGWGNSFLGVNENGRGLTCTFKGIGRPVDFQSDYCPSAGPIDKDCIKETEESSSLSGDTLGSKYVESIFRKMVLTRRFIKRCSLQLRQGLLTYKVNEQTWDAGHNPRIDKIECIYGVKEEP